MEHTAKIYKVKSGMKLYEQVLTQIREMIVQGVYGKGDLLPSEKELMDMMGVSRITVREALRILAESGVIETRRGKGSYVRIDAGELQQYSEDSEEYRKSFLLSTDARLMLEPAVAASLAGNISQEMLDSIAGCFDDDQPPSAFHAALIAASNNPLISRWFAETVELEAGSMMTRMIPPAKQKGTARMLEEQHRRIYEAIRDGHEVQAYFYMKEHLEFIRGIYDAYFSTFFC